MFLEIWSSKKIKNTRVRRNKRKRGKCGVREREFEQKLEREFEREFERESLRKRV